MKTTTARLTIIAALAAVIIIFTLPTFAAEKDVKVVAVEGKERAAGEHIAILVGVEKYQNPIESLKYTVDDTKLLAEALTKYGVYDRVITIADDTDTEPLKSNILRKLAVETGNASSNDSILFYFSGHGISIEGKDYLIPADAFMAGNNMSMLASTALSVDEISAILKESPAKSQLIIIDACRNMGGKAMGDAPGFEDMAGSQDSIRIVSAKTGQRSYEWDAQGHGVFTYFFVKGLHGEADGYASNEQDGVVTAIEAFNYTREQMKDWGRDNDSVQTPQLLSESNEEMALSILDFFGRKPTGPREPAMVIPDSLTEFVQGSGQIANEIRDVSGFSCINITAKGTIKITQSDSESIRIEAEDNIIPYIETNVQSHTLNIGVRNGVTLVPLKDVKIYVQLKELRCMKIEGDANIENGKLNIDHLELTSSGNSYIQFSNLEANSLGIILSGGIINIAGEVEEQSLNISGNGKCFASNLRSLVAGVNVSGNGSAEINVTDKLDGTVYGSGTIRYKGSPTISQNILGNGTIRHISD